MVDLQVQRKRDAALMHSAIALGQASGPRLIEREFIHRNVRKPRVYPKVKTGLEVFLRSRIDAVNHLRIGLLCNQASVNSQLQSAVDLFADKFGQRLTAIFTPQHGFWGEEQANMIETQHSVHRRLGIPVYSLYSETRQPTPEMLDRIDCLVVDLQDVGTRVYTFIWTLLAAMQACEQAGKLVVVLDRPNPLGGAVCEGPMLAAGFESFVGNSHIPLRHGLTIAELAELFHRRHTPKLALVKIAMEGWERSLMFDRTGLPWVWPSPNMQRLETAVLYPGQVLLEGTNLSEGRGTTLPFEVTGAPYIKAEEWCEELSRYELPGVRVRPIRFRPVFDKWKNQSCGGLQIHIVDPEQVRSVAVTLAMLQTARELSPNEFEWLPPPYEYETEKLPIDILAGTPSLREAVDLKILGNRQEVDRMTELNITEWKELSCASWLY